MVKAWAARGGLAFVSALALYFGVHGLYVRFSNWRPTELSCAEYLAARPSSKWVRLTGCWYERSRARVIERKDRQGRVLRADPYAPLVESSPRSGLVRAFAFVEKLEPGAPDLPAPPIEGLSLTPFASGVGGLLRGHDVDPDFLIVDPRERPGLVAPLVALLLGAALAAGLAMSFAFYEAFNRACDPPLPQRGP